MWAEEVGLCFVLLMQMLGEEPEGLAVDFPKQRGVWQRVAKEGVEALP